MTTTAHEDQFTDAPEPVRQPYDTGSILRRNVADLEIALKQQTALAESAGAELLAVREDNHSMMLEIDGLRKELAKLREQKPALYMAFSDCGNFIRYWTRDTKNLEATMAVNDFEVLEFYAAPVPAPAHAVNEGGWKRFTDDDLAEIHQLAYELGGTDSGEYLLDGDQLDQVVVKCASLFYAFPVQSAPAPAVPASIVPDGDDFNGTTPHLIQCMEALVRLDADGVLVPHGIGRDASKLLTAAANRLRKQTAPAVPDGMMLVMAQDANNYCRILTLLGMEEEGDPVGAVSTMLQSTQTVPEECQHCKKAWEMAPVAWYRKRSDGGVDGPLMDDDSRMCAVRRKEWNPLYERPFYPDFLNYRQGFNDGIEEIRYELKQLCKDFSDLQNRPYMGDVHAQVDAICERALLQSAEVRHD